ncbi:MAG TPA: YaaL family protein [Firmicutes bacterium]|nr:YaaL family protein [Bacillota bacterium]
MSMTLAERLRGFAKSFLAEVEEVELPEEGGERLLIEQVEQARQEWLAARSYFDNVTDTVLIDHAILSLQAAERKYVYLLDQAKRSGVRCKTYWAVPHHRME